MADDTSEKVIIEIDADTGAFTTKVGGVTTQLTGLKESGSDLTSAWALGITGVNQALDLGQKLLAAWDAAVANMAQTEAWQNQETALKNLGTQVGLTGSQMELLVKTIQQATGGTVTQVQATTDAFKLLNAGFQSDTIPNIMKYAELLSQAKGIPIDQTVDAFSRALMTGNTRALAPFEIQLAKTGNTAQMTAAIMAAIQNQTIKFGDGYVDTAEKMKAKSEDAWNSVKKFFGGITESIAVSAFGDQTDKASRALEAYKGQLDKITQGRQVDLNMITALVGAQQPLKTNEEARMVLIAKIGEAQEKFLAAKTQENADEQKNISQLQQKGELLKAINPLLANKEALKAMAEAETEMYRKGDSDAQANAAMQKKLVDQEFLEKQQELAAIPQTVQQFHEKIKALEIQHQAALKAIKAKEPDTDAAVAAARIKIVDSTNLMIEGAEKLRMTSLKKAEDDEYKKNLDRLAAKGLSEKQFNVQVEQEELRHQTALSKIETDNMKLTTQNVKLGWKSAIDDMRKTWDDWGSLTKKVATQSQNVLSQGFIQMAKDHKFAMDQMLNQFLEFIGETLVQKGTADLLMSIFPPDPAGLAAGAAEIALGSALVGATSSGGSSAASPGSSAAGANTGGLGPTQVTPVQTTSQQKGAQIIINGFLNTRQSATAIADILRNNADVTDYSVTAQGQNWATG